MLKIIERVFLVLLAAAIIGLGIGAIIKSQAAIKDADRIILEADEFLAKYESRFGR